MAGLDCTQGRCGSGNTLSYGDPDALCAKIEAQQGLQA